MPRRSSVAQADVVELRTLMTAFWQAAKTKRLRRDVQRFSGSLDAELARIRDDVLSGRAPEGRWTSFHICDPKPRRILAPCFSDRVLHHAMMLPMGPVLERSLVADTFACRTGKGTLAAVLRAQQHVRRYPWFVKADVRAYFASIDHEILLRLLARRFKDPGLLGLANRVLERTPLPSGRGLPIGALTSQWFANLYLDGLDRFLLEGLRVRGMVRYMDDVVWWCDSKREARESLRAARAYLRDERALDLKEDAQIGRSAQGASFLGFRVFPGQLRLSLRRRRRYRAARARWETAFATGKISAVVLQARYASALAITAHASASRFRATDLTRRSPLDV